MALRKKGRKRKEEAEELDEIEEMAEPEEETGRRGRKKFKKALSKKKEPGRDSSVIYRDGEMPRLHGKGVAARMAFTISAALALILIFFGIVLYNVQASALDDMIDSGGIEAVHVLASTDYGCWDTLHGTGHEGKGDDVKNRKVTLTEAASGRMKLNKDRLVPLIHEDSQILIAMIKDSRGGTIIRCSSEGALETDFSRKKSQKVGDVEIYYGDYFLNKVKYTARVYRCPINNYADERLGWAEIVLSEEQITSSKFNMLLTMLALTVIFIAIGIGVAFFMGKKIAVPAKALIEDVSIVAGGDLEHHTVPKSQDEIGLLARTFDKMTKNLHEAQQQERELAAQRHQVAVGREVMAKLLPDVIPQIDGYDIQAFNRASKDMGGNYYDVVKYPDGKVMAMVASASGKGIPAAMVMTMGRSLMRALVGKYDDLSGMVRECNRLLSPDLRSGMYVEVVMVLVDPSSHKARFVSAGPTLILRFDAGKGKLMALQADGIAMGFDKGPVFDKTLKEVEIDFNKGDRLVLSPEGIFGIKGADGSELGTKGFARFVGKHATLGSADFVRRLVNNLDSFAGGKVRAADITFVTIKRK